MASNRHRTANLKITHEMSAAGAKVLEAYDPRFDDPLNVVNEIFRAMMDKSSPALILQSSSPKRLSSS